MGEEELSHRIQTLESPEELRRCFDLQKAIWKSDESDLMTVRMLDVALANGSLAIGAFGSSSDLEGFALSFPCPWGRKVSHHSHMVGVLERARDNGLGTRLKLQQRKMLKERDVKFLTWTFDPLRSRNACLNLTKLRVRVLKYYCDLYGATSSPLHAGSDTDRLLVLWDFSRLEKSESPSKFSPSIPQVISTTGSGKYLMPRDVDLSFESEQAYLEIPWAIQEHPPESKRAWRKATREAFLRLEKLEYSIRELVTQKSTKEMRAYYRFTKSGSEGKVNE